MSHALPVVYSARHGETAWTISRQHTGLTDLPLTAQGEAEAVRLGERPEGVGLAAVLASLLQRAVRTCELAGFGSLVKSSPTFRNRTTTHMRAAPPPTSTPGAPTGTCSATAAGRGVAGSSRSVGRPGSAGCEPSKVTCCSFREDTGSLHAGSGWSRESAGTSSSARPALARWGMSTIGPTR
jgi:hypothetical protein